MYRLQNIAQRIGQHRFVLLLLVSIWISSGISVAQSGAISLAVPEHLIPLFEDTILPEFQATDPGFYVEVRPISTHLLQDLQLPASSATLDAYFEAIQQLAESADVQFITGYDLSPEATRTGYFLDIAPLVAADPSLSPEVFLPGFWDAFRWDQALWALPTHITPIVIGFDPVAFDAANLAYPNEDWTFDDYASAAQQLTASPALQVSANDLPAFLHILTNQTYTTGDFLSQPDLQHPQLLDLLDQWAALENQGVVTSGFVPNAPIRFMRYNQIPSGFEAVFPQRKAGTDTYAATISSGTADVDAAYHLVRYLTTVPQLVESAPGSLPVRWDVATSAPSAAPDITAFENLVTPADLQFGHYLIQSISLIRAGEAADVVMQNAQATAEANLLLAASQPGASVIQIEPPTIPVALADDTIRFGLFVGTTVLPNRNLWEAMLADFQSANPDIAEIELNFIAPVSGYWDEFDDNDCIFGFSADGFDTDLLLPLDPLLDADPSFDPDDVVGDILLQSQRDGVTYTLPVVVFPMLLQYNPDRFAQAGVPLPNATWTIDEFVTALHQLHANMADPPLDFYSNDLTSWEMLVVAYGETLIDYTTTPHTLRFDDEAVVTALRQVLDLAKGDLISYQPMSTFFPLGMDQPYAPAIISQQSNLSWLDGPQDGYEVVSFPLGRERIPISFYLTGGFIFANATNPEGCYRLLREITVHPELYHGMPAYHAIINDPVTQAVHGAGTVATFRRIADVMEDPQRVFVQSYLELGERLIIARAFDRYVLEDADLTDELDRVMALIPLYRACYEETGITVSCLLEVDPTLRDFIPDHILPSDG